MINLSEIDMVVLKRNLIDDATHTDGHHSFYVGKDKNYYFSSCDKAWRETWKNTGILKPIEKPMKEYLRKNSNGTYSYIGTVRPEHVSDFMIEIPEGAIRARFYPAYPDNGIEFENQFAQWWHTDELEWIYYMDAALYNHSRIVWQRHALPEDLPFVDDEPSLNDQYAEIEKVRQNSKLDQSISDFKNTDHGKEFDAFDLIEDTVNHPSHYASGEIECIDAIESSMTNEAFCGYLKGNVQKYMWRYENKGGLESLEKAQWYLNKLISRIG